MSTFNPGEGRPYLAEIRARQIQNAADYSWDQAALDAAIERAHVRLWEEELAAGEAPAWWQQ